MRLIVGLGNPGEQYRLTPHNLGFSTIDQLAFDAGIRVSRPEANSLAGVGEIEGEPVTLAKPLSYMNSSGGPVARLLEKYELSPDRLLLVYDELALPWGELRLKQHGSAAGHNGVSSVIEVLGTMEFARLRLGIHPGRPVDGKKYVLQPMGRRQVKEAEEIVGRAADVVRLMLSEGAEKAMAATNRRAPGPRNDT